MYHDVETYPYDFEDKGKVESKKIEVEGNIRKLLLKHTKPLIKKPQKRMFQTLDADKFNRDLMPETKKYLS